MHQEILNAIKRAGISHDEALARLLNAGQDLVNHGYYKEAELVFHARNEIILRGE